MTAALGPELRVSNHPAWPRASSAGGRPKTLARGQANQTDQATAVDDRDETNGAATMHLRSGGSIAYAGEMTADYSRQSLAAAFASADPNNPVALEIAKSVDRLAHLLVEQSDAGGRMPGVLFVPTPLCEIDIFAFDVFKAEVQALGIEVRLVSPRCNA